MTPNEPEGLARGAGKAREAPHELDPRSDP